LIKTKSVESKYEDIFIPLSKSESIDDSKRNSKKEELRIEYSFYYNGYPVDKSMTFYEIKSKFSTVLLI